MKYIKMISSETDFIDPKLNSPSIYGMINDKENKLHIYGGIKTYKYSLVILDGPYKDAMTFTYLQELDNIDGKITLPQNYDGTKLYIISNSEIEDEELEITIPDYKNLYIINKWCTKETITKDNIAEGSILQNYIGKILYSPMEQVQ